MLALVVIARPETVRFYLQWAYAWIPAGAWLAVLYLLWRRRGAVDRTALLVALFLGAATLNTYASFLPFPNAAFPEATPYVLPLAAAFLVWLHCRRAGRPGAGRAAPRHGLARRAGHRRRRARRARRPPGDRHRARSPRNAGRAAGGRARRSSARSTSSPPTRARVTAVLIAPQLTSLYVLADRRDPLPQLSLLPGALATAADEDRAIARLGDVRLAVVDRTPLRTYEHGAFGTTFDRRLAGWLRRDFRRLETARGTGADPRQIDVWIRP